MNDNRHILLDFLPVGATELRRSYGEQNVDESLSVHGFASSEMVPLEDTTAQKCRTVLREERD